MEEKGEEMNIRNLDEIDLSYGHVIEEHINVSDQELIQRLLYGDFRDLRYTGKTQKIVTKFESAQITEQTVKNALQFHIEKIKEWLRLRYDNRLVIQYNSLSKLGHGYAKYTDFRKNVYDMYSCIIILELGYNGSEFHIVTAYPVPNQAMWQKIQNDRNIFWEKKKQGRRY